MSSVLAENVKRLMKANYLSVDDVAKKACLNKCTVYSVIHDEHEPHKETVKRLAYVFNVSEDRLMNEKIMVEVANVGKKIKALYKKHHMSQEKLAKKACVQQCTISCVTRGKNKPQKLTLKRIARAFGLTVEELLAYNEEA